MKAWMLQIWIYEREMAEEQLGLYEFIAASGWTAPYLSNDGEIMLQKMSPNVKFCCEGLHSSNIFQAFSPLHFTKLSTL